MGTFFDTQCPQIYFKHTPFEDNDSRMRNWLPRGGAVVFEK